MENVININGIALFNPTLIDFHNALTWALEDAQKHARPYPATVTISKFVRLHVNPEGVFSVGPMGWKPYH